MLKDKNILTKNDIAEIYKELNQTSYNSRINKSKKTINNVFKNDINDINRIINYEKNSIQISPKEHFIFRCAIECAYFHFPISMWKNIPEIIYQLLIEDNKTYIIYHLLTIYNPELAMINEAFYISDPQSYRDTVEQAIKIITKSQIKAPAK